MKKKRTFRPPYPEDFTITVEPAFCPICGGRMVHTEIRTDNLDAYHGWLCPCESQPEDILEIMVSILDDTDEENPALVIVEGNQ